MHFHQRINSMKNAFLRLVGCVFGYTAVEGENKSVVSSFIKKELLQVPLFLPAILPHCI